MQVSSLHFPCLCYSARERILKDTISPQQKEHKGSQQLRGIFSIFQKSGSWGWGGAHSGAAVVESHLLPSRCPGPQELPTQGGVWKGERAGLGVGAGWRLN